MKASWTSGVAIFGWLFTSLLRVLRAVNWPDAAA